MITPDDVYAVAVRYAGLADGEQSCLMQLCRAALTRLRRDLADGVEETDCADSLICAAGMLAAADLTAASAGAEQFKAGPVSVTRDDCARAKRLREEAALLLAPWCRGAFRFLSV